LDGRLIRQLTRSASTHYVGDEVDVEIRGPTADSIPIR